VHQPLTKEGHNRNAGEYEQYHADDLGINPIERPNRSRIHQPQSVHPSSKSFEHIWRMTVATFRVAHLVDC